MQRLRMAMGTLAALALLAFGAAACTPEQQAQVQQNLSTIQGNLTCLIAAILTLGRVEFACGDPNIWATTAPAPPPTA